MREQPPRPSYYALGSGGWRDYWTLLHPPYTLWHLSYVAIGAATAKTFDLAVLGWSLLAFFMAMGVAAHALDESKGRPLRTQIPTGVLRVLALAGLGGAILLGIAGCFVVSPWLIVFMAVGTFIVPAYCLEWFDGAFHTSLVFALAWGSFPVIVGAFAQDERIGVAAVVAAGACAALSAAQRKLSTPVRFLRRQVAEIDGEIVTSEGQRIPITAGTLRDAPEGALKIMPYAVALLALSGVLERLVS